MRLSTGAEYSSELLGQLRPHLSHPYKLVRSYIAQVLSTIFRNIWAPVQVAHRTDALLKTYEGRATSFVTNVVAEVERGWASESAEEREATVRCLKTVLQWVGSTFQMGALSLVCYLPQLLPLIFKAPELSDDVELQASAK